MNKLDSVQGITRRYTKRWFIPGWIHFYVWHLVFGTRLHSLFYNEPYVYPVPPTNCIGGVK